ncbi:helix-turn-helix domain-containing protein [Leifsonia shinshuensis]|uniref:Helix-turn-helix domain-containing protein n=1 Tax=Leifsonia shinshuensis TaxID=150026 RepID=A0A7G6Y9R1_9MICO|nr:helix-turn-helix domain-containing protein [Leifsonia shinshuensis]QNE35226.1 helix-turn-helix domain-containing protein [Leifsonia shinshuensis]
MIESVMSGKMMSPAAGDPSSFGFSVWRGAPGSMERAHTHDDVELNVATGSLEYVIRGERVVVPPGVVLLFWASQPHQLVGFERDAEVTWLTVPLRTLLGWQLPAGFVERFLRGGLTLVEPGAGSFDAAALDRWRHELAEGGFAAETARKDIEVHVRRVAVSAGEAQRDGGAGADGDRAAAVVARMAAFAAENAHRNPRVAEVAAAVHLHPQYAMTLFKRVLGVSIGSYLTTCRIHDAQRLLVTTTDPVALVAEKVGYGSLSQFYDKFRQVTGCSPAVYRRGRVESG